jgi:hypothetical protein
MPQEWPDQNRDTQLTDLHPRIEPREWRHDIRAASADTKFLQRSGEAKAMNETERECELPARVHLASHEVLGADKDDRQGDDWLHHSPRQADKPQHRKRQRQRMRDGERGHGLGDAAQALKAKQERREEEQVIVAAQDVMNPSLKN